MALLPGEVLGELSNAPAVAFGGPPVGFRWRKRLILVTVALG